MLGLFLEAQGHPLPQHSQTKSPSALSRFLNQYDWGTRQIIRAVRKAILKELLTYAPRGRRPWLQVIVDLLTSCSRTKERLAERVKKVEKGVEVKKQQNNGNHSYTSPDPSLYIAIPRTVVIGVF
jgi:hypothetical protein